MPAENAIVPDDKDWTWVLERPCPECGFDATAVRQEDVPRLLRENALAWPPVLRRPDVRERPDPATWSPLEYACHVRDVFYLYDRRLFRMLNEDDPEYPNWDQDESAIERGYAQEAPAALAKEIVSAGETIAARFASLEPEQWARTGRRSDGATFTVESFARYLVHDPVHHLYDVTRPRA